MSWKSLGKDLSTSQGEYLNYIMLPQNENTKSNRTNARARNNQFIFALAMVALQILISVLYGIYVGGKYGALPVQQLNIGSTLTVHFFALLVVVGFGLFFGNFKNLAWNGLGFALLITALSIELYPLVNSFWAKANIHTNGIYSNNFDVKGLRLFLANMDSKTYENNTITGAIKCALAIIIAFSSVIGRIGPLECLIMTVVGTVGYELNRSISINFGQDAFGTFSVFTFGGFLGLTLGIFMTVRQRRNDIKTQGNTQLDGTQISAVTSLIGGIFIFILLPFFAFEGDQSLQTSIFHRYITPVSILLSIGSSLTSSIGFSIFVTGDERASFRIKDILNAVVAGGMVAGAASFYITTSYLAMIAGAAAGILQYIFDNWLEKLFYSKFGVISTHSFMLFCLQGLVGAVFAAAYSGRVTNINMTNDFAFNPNLKDYGQQFVIYFISSAFGIACGIASGFPCYFINAYRSKDLFHDRTEFRPNDGINIRKPRSEITAKPTIKLDQENKPEPSDPNQNSNIIHDQLPENLPIDATEYSDNEFSFDFADMLQVAIQ